MKRLAKQTIAAIQNEVLSWYAVNKRDLPWRRTSDPYHILVSEIMLQQTQVSRVIPKYHEFLKQFPTVQTLAAASPAAVIRSWKGLGYNRRALNLQRAAKAVVDTNLPTPGVGRCDFPRTVEELMKLPGIGRYTAGAVATFAFGAIVPAVDTNVRRFIDHYFPQTRPRREHSGSELGQSHSRSGGGARKESDYYDIAARLIPADQPGAWLHAVMDYTSLVLRRAVPPQSRRLQSKKPPRFSRPGRSEPFIGSNRYLRGRTIDLLRDGAVSADELNRRVAKPVVVGEDRFGLILDALESEGLIEKVRHRFQLKES